MSDPRTLGIEEEFLLADPETWQTVPAADDVLARLPASPADADGPGMTDEDVGDPAWHGELRASQVEAATGVCTTATALHRQLITGRRGLAAAAHAEGLALVASGAPALPSPAVPLGPDPQYAELDGLYRGLIGDYEGCGCHVHVGVADREAAIVAVNALRPWLPTLLALSANSPYERGHDTGYASWRTIQHSRFPTAGIPPRFAGVAEHDALVERLVTSGALGAEYTTFWFARPSPALPTVEVRVADTATTPDEALLQALLSRALVDTALAGPADGTPASASEPLEDVLPAAVWSAARYGLGGRGVDPWTGHARPAAELVDALLDHVRPALERSGDADLVDAMARRIVTDGSGAQRQRRAAAHGIRHAVRTVADDTIRDLPE